MSRIFILFIIMAFTSILLVILNYNYGLDFILIFLCLGLEIS